METEVRHRECVHIQGFYVAVGLELNDAYDCVLSATVCEVFKKNLLIFGFGPILCLCD